MHTIHYGERTIHFNLTFSDRKTLEIAVLPDQNVYVKAPMGKRVDEVLKRVQKRARWIVKQQEYFASASHSFPPKQYVSGETFRYLGKQYRLKVIAPDQQTNGSQQPALSLSKENECVKLIGRYIRVYTNRKKDAAHVKKLLDQWYRTHAEKKFAERIEICSQVMRKYGLARPPVQIRSMKNRWGSYTPAGKILLNPRLIECPTYCIDYVILHELCHVKYPNHGKAFYRLLAIVLPEWQMIKERLESGLGS